MPNDAVTPCPVCLGTGESLPHEPPASEDIPEARKRLECLRREEGERHRLALARIDADLAELRKRCTHPPGRITYHPDPSGNNDSFFQCQVCGLERKRF